MISELTMRILLGFLTAISGIVVIIIAPVGSGSEIGLVVLALGGLQVLYA